jgi:hypothetical protein
MSINPYGGDITGGKQPSSLARLAVLVEQVPQEE